MGQIRPRLTEQEIRFVLYALVNLEGLLEGQRGEVEALERKVYFLRKELLRNTMVYKDLRLAREELAKAKAEARGSWHKKIICHALLRRFRALVEGGKLHTSSWAESYLNKILEPKSIEKS